MKIETGQPSRQEVQKIGIALESVLKNSGA